MFEPVKLGFSGFMARFYAGVVPTTEPLQEFVARGLTRSCAWVPGRMVDAAEEMLSLYARDDLSPGPTKPPPLPVIFVGMAKDYAPIGRDFTRPVADRVEVMVPGDDKDRLFGIRTVTGEIRTQVVVVAHDEPSARSLASQFLLFLEGTENRRFAATYRFAGKDHKWPVQIESTDVPAINVQTDNKNLTLLALDLTLKATLPLMDAPGAGDPNDDKGTVDDATDPSGYPVVVSIDGFHNEIRHGLPGSEIRDWNVSAPMENPTWH